ncbi:MAG: glycosyltransferase family 2 protein [Myxococcota bacterium]|nr:glycosyltransferase family 2 protein [Myxococcota bacterium]
MFAIVLLLVLLSLPVVACATYLFVLALFSRRPQVLRSPESRMRFDFIVPAHNEERGIAETVRSLLAVDYPVELRRVVVVADNCGDSTAARAEEAGALVLVRHDEKLRGKGHALKFAFDRFLSEGIAGVAVVVDADTVVSPNLLRAFAARIESGAGAVQAEYGVRNPKASWRTRLMLIALATFHGVRSLGRERLGVSCGLRGNGMGFSRRILTDVPYDAFSIVEDLEYGIRLALGGCAVRYVPEARVLGEMVSTERASRSQRRRWEGGRYALAKMHGGPLVRAALARREPVLLDMAMDLLVPPLTYVFGAALVGAAASIAIVAAAGRYTATVAPWVIAIGMVVVYVLRGVALSGTGARGLLDLAWAPVYMTWKLALSLSSLKRSPGEWVRTAREDEKPQ